MSFTVYNISDNIFHVEFYSRVTMCKTMLRMSETSEGPAHQGKVFTLAEYKVWYRANNPRGKIGKFTYYRDWAGFNITDKVVRRFYNKEFHPLSKLERQLLNSLVEYNLNKEWLCLTESHPYSIIATAKDVEDRDVLAHELAHARYYTNPKYHDAVNQILSTIDPQALQTLKNWIISIGYVDDDSIILDECHAYFATEEGLEWLQERHNLDINPYRSASEAIRNILFTYANYCAILNP